MYSNAYIYSNMLLVLHVPMFVTETRSPEEVATDTSREGVFAHHATSPGQQQTVIIKSISCEVGSLQFTLGIAKWTTMLTSIFADI